MIKICTFGDVTAEIVYSSVGTLIKKNKMFCLYRIEMENQTYLVKHYYGLFGWLGIFDLRTWKSRDFEMMLDDIHYEPNVEKVVVCYSYNGSPLHRQMLETGARKYLYVATPVVYCEIGKVGLIAYVEGTEEKGLRYLTPDTEVKVCTEEYALQLLKIEN